MIHVVAFTLLVAQPPSTDVLADVQTSHIQANVPAPEDFDRLLTRDLEQYFKGRAATVVDVRHEMLRDGPTQSGVAYPKFYAWVRVLDGAKVVDQGAVRLAAIGRKEFQITDFVSEANIRANPKAIYKVFPAPVCERIRAKLGLRAPEAP